MPILTRLTGQHLDDAAYAEIWTNAVADRTRVVHPHLDACAECRIGFAAFTAWLDEVRADARAEADAVFPNERLLAQQSQVLRRLEALDQPTRVLPFPGKAVPAARRSPVRRWVAAAAAAGLVAGLSLGQLMDLRHMSSGPSTFPADRQADAGRAPLTGAPAIAPAAGVVTLINDDPSLEELEEAATPRYEALRAYDTFTPRAADLIASAR